MEQCDDGDMISTMDYNINTTFPQKLDEAWLMIHFISTMDYMYIIIYILPDSDCK